MYQIAENKFYGLKCEFAQSELSPFIRVIKREYNEEGTSQTIYYQEISVMKTAHDEKFLEKYDSIPHNI